MRMCVGLLSAVVLVTSSAGLVLAEDIMTAKDLPEAVRTTLEKEAKDAVIEDVEKEKGSDGATYYEVELERNNQEWKLRIDEKGKVIDRKREAESAQPGMKQPSGTQQPSGAQQPSGTKESRP